MKHLDWNRARAFLATAQAGSLSAAARALGLTQPTLSRQVAALEAELGVLLFERLGKRLVLTDTGRSLLDHVTAMGAAADALALAATGNAHEVAGTVRISASDGFAAYLLPDIVRRIRAEAPRVTLSILASNSISDLRRREADIAIRHVRPEEPELIGRRVRDVHAGFYASRTWLARAAPPAALTDLPGRDLLAFEETDRFAGYMRALGLEVSSEDFRICSASSVVIWELARRGLGVAAMLREIARQDPEMVPVFPDLPETVVPVWLVTHRELHTARRIRQVFDLLVAALGPSGHEGDAQA